MTWRERFNRMRKHYGWSWTQINDITGMNSAKQSMNQYKEDIPNWLKLAVTIFEIENGYAKEDKRPKSD